MDSILDSVKKFCGVLPEHKEFDAEILMAINSVMFTLSQLGVGPSEPFIVEDEYQTWDELLGSDPVGGVRAYVNIRSRMLFDPPTNTYVKQALDDEAKELEWRIIAEVDKKEYAAEEVSSE